MNFKVGDIVVSTMIKYPVASDKFWVVKEIMDNTSVLITRKHKNQAFVAFKKDLRYPEPEELV